MRLHGELARFRTLWRPLVVTKYLRGTQEPALHLGCGHRHVEGWLNVDKYNANADTYLNAYRRFPFGDGTFALIFFEHMIEHLEIERIHRFLLEVYRVLRPGGTCRITCPDLELYAKHYVEGNDGFFQEVLKSVEGKREKHSELMWLVRTRGGAFMTSAVKSFHRHRWMYDFETFDACLKDVGFREVRQRRFGESGIPRLAAMDSAERSFESLYVECVK